MANRLRQMGYIPLAIDKKDDTGFQKEIKLPFGQGKRVKLKDIAVFSRQFATMINSGLTLLRSLTILAQQTENPALAEIIDQVRLDVERGASLSRMRPSTASLSRTSSGVGMRRWPEYGARNPGRSPTRMSASRTSLTSLFCRRSYAQAEPCNPAPRTSIFM